MSNPPIAGNCGDCGEWFSGWSCTYCAKEKREAEEEAARVKQEQEKAKKEDEGKKK